MSIRRSTNPRSRYFCMSTIDLPRTVVFIASTRERGGARLQSGGGDRLALTDGSVRLGAGELNDLNPLLSLIGNELAEIGGGNRQQLVSEGGQSRRYFCVGPP